MSWGLCFMNTLAQQTSPKHRRHLGPNQRRVSMHVAGVAQNQPRGHAAFSHTLSGRGQSWLGTFSSALHVVLALTCVLVISSFLDLICAPTLTNTQPLLVELVGEHTTDVVKTSNTVAALRAFDALA